ncbi:hypothetical protein PO656_11260, partial [Enterobacter kobei]|uniref:hypothetical protein n=1 Tax=Enterobacter kobei TaxID=208224 RepID=UPI0020736E0B
KRAYCLKTQPATGETYPKSDLFNKAPFNIKPPVCVECYPPTKWVMSKMFFPLSQALGECML